ncbi:hypothetical protein PPL_05835 [Heterostelium album PN500]|uniref:Protein kinase domain-containing protein n=1 Tax=Heterostelium pallidum (strain ATCC 26659 / Pp 5 / PN500) TaxID=670386 RepID=D3BBG7_HETP5|nr:hypothetical protein PPL_05835 [Heterostelium album PN500]EFA81000.1 hypothetical protein PPL_05835 [Heterostelium album PN500]|eukprot:XP_020433118.1 hypothetical protein PPL_05835 [Heterostelium album PN500]
MDKSYDDFKFNFDHVLVNNQQYELVSRFPNSNAINDVYLVIGPDQRLINYKNIEFKDYPKTYKRALNEIKALKLFKGNRKFVQLVDYHDDKYNQIFHVITEYCKGGDLSQNYKNLTDSNLIFKETEIRDFILQLFNILVDLEEHRIVHCDIKPSNIFIVEHRLVLGDFGSCTFLNESPIIEYHVTSELRSLETIDLILNELSEPTKIGSGILASRGTIGYIAPEAMYKQYSQSCDIYSIGSTILKLLSCHEDDRNNHRIFQMKSEIKISKERYSKLLFDFVHRLLDQNQKNRESLHHLDNYIENIDNKNSFTINYNIPLESSLMNQAEIVFGERDNNQPVQSNTFRPNLRALTFGDSFNQQIPICTLPKTLEYLSFGRYFNQQLKLGALPDSLLSLDFGYGFNQIFTKGVLPSSLKLLTMVGYNHKIEIDCLPQQLEYLELSLYNQDIETYVLPNTLKSLTLGTFETFPNGFNQQLAVGVLPKSLQVLRLGSFTHKLEIGVLPTSLTSLTLSRNYDHIFQQGVFPNSLRSLTIDDYSQPICIGVLPSSLRDIWFVGEFDQDFFVHQKSSKPKDVSDNDIKNKTIELPQSLESLIIGVYDRERKMPSNLKTLLIFGAKMVVEVFKLTDSLESLQYIREYHPEYAMPNIDSPINQISGENITALLLSGYRNVLIVLVLELNRQLQYQAHTVNVRRIGTHFLSL